MPVRQYALHETASEGSLEASAGTKCHSKAAVLCGKGKTCDICAQKAALVNSLILGIVQSADIK